MATRRPTARRPSAARPGAPSGRSAAAPASAAVRGARPSRWRFWARVPAKELARLTGRLEILVNAGLPLVRCLRILEGQQRPGPLRDTVAAVGDDVESGAPLSEALAKYPQVFDRLYVNMVRAGEAGGMLGVVLGRLAAFGKKRELIKGQIRGAMTYPVLVLAFAGLILIGTMIFIVPRFQQMFESYDTEMPWLTMALMHVSQAIITGWYWIVLALAAIVAICVMCLRNETVARGVDAATLRLPILGDLVRKTTVARLTRTLGTLLGSGVPILEALSIVRASITNRIVREALDDVHDSIREGESIAAPLEESGIFDDMVVNMIDVGEETGQLDTMLVRIADDYETEVDTSVTVLFKALEPIMLLGVALVVGFIAFALFSPMLQLMDTFSRT